MLKGFKEFLMRGNMIDLAVGVVMGAAFNSVVNAFVKDILTPIISIFFKAQEFSSLSFSINGSKFVIGDFINTLISFILSATAVYFFIIVPLNTLAKVRGQASPTKKCPQCLSDVPSAAKRCAFCTQELA